MSQEAPPVRKNARGSITKRDMLGEDEYKNNGRPDKAELVRQWRLEHPEGRKVECIKDTGLSKPTVYKWWD